MKVGKYLCSIIFVLCMLFPFTACNKATPLESPTGFTVDDNYNITWMNVVNSRGYEIDIVNSVTGDAQTATARRANISLAFLSEGDYDVRIKAKGDGERYSDSQWSPTIYFVKSAELGCIYKLIGNGSEYQLSSVSPTLTSITLQDSYRGKPVTKIGESAFRKATKIQEVTLGKYINEVGKRAFFNCVELTSIQMPDTVNSIGEAAFQACKVLKSFSFPANVRRISKSTFAYCRELTTVELNNVTVIEPSAFESCSALETFTLTDKVTMVYDNAFKDCANLKSFTLGNGVQYLGNQVFRDCVALDTLTFGDSGNLKLLGSNVFANCALTSVNLPDGLERIGDYAFFGNKNMTNVTIPDSVTQVGYRAFNDTKMCIDAQEAGDMFLYVDNWLVETFADANTKPLNNIVKAGEEDTANGNYAINEGTVGIADYVFMNCSTLEDATMPNSILYLGNYTFAYCEKLWRFSSAGTNLKIIGAGAFSNCVLLQRPLIAHRDSSKDKLEEIGAYAFYGCKALDYNGSSTGTRFIPTTVKRIGTYAFKETLLYDKPDEFGVIYADDWVVGCTGSYGLGEGGLVTMPEVETFATIDLRQDTRGIADYAFFLCFDLTTLNNTNVVRYLGIGSFYYCNKLVSYTFNADMREIPDYAFYECNALMLDSLPRRLTSIGRSAFYNCEMISSVTIPNTVESLGQYAYYGCKNLRSLEIGSGLTEISDYTFYNCSKLNEVVIPSNIKKIGNSAFSGCASMTSLTIEEGVEEIGNFAFKGNVSLKEINLPDSVKTLGKYAFFKCRKVESVDLASVENIGSFAFAMAISIKTLVLPDTIKSIGQGAFFYAGNQSLVEEYEDIFDIFLDESLQNPNANSGMKSVIICGDIPKIDEHAFYGLNYATFYVECANKNSVWGKGWNSSYRPTVWGVTLSEDKSYVVSITVTKDTFENTEALNGIYPPAREGYKFAGWSTSPSATEITYTAEEVAQAPVGSVLYAVYVEDTQVQQ